MRFLNHGDMEQMKTLRDEIEAGMAEWDLLLPTPDYVLEKGLAAQGMTCGTFVDDRLIGLRSVHFPKPRDPEHIGRQAGLATAELNSVAELKLSLVSVEYRGNSLQKRMTAHLFEQMNRLGMHFDHYMAIVSPKNIPSMSEKFSFKMKISKIIIKNNNFVRCLFTRSMLENAAVPENAAVYVPNRDFEKQSELLKQGYSGYRLRRGPSQTCEILYAK
jgi:hypothetical protein